MAEENSMSTNQLPSDTNPEISKSSDGSESVKYVSTVTSSNY